MSGAPVVARHHYRAYRNCRFDWRPLFDEINGGQSQRDVARAHDVPLMTLNNHYRKYVSGVENDDPNVVAEADGHVNGRKRSRRMLSDAEEAEIHREYKADCDRGVVSTDDDLGALATRVYDNHHAIRTRAHHFSGSKRFVTRYKRDHRISTGVVKSRRRPKSFPSEETQHDEATEFFDQVNRALETYPPSLIINEDETSGKVVSAPRTGLRDIGSGPPEAIHKSSDKLCASIAAAVAVNGTKLKSALIAKGKTALSLRKFELPRSFVGLLNNSGWMDGPTFIKWIDMVLLPYTKSQRCALICDGVPLHKTPAVLAHCAANNIDIIFVPRWNTAHYQPLDVGVFGPVKQIMRKEWKLDMRARRDKTDTLAGMIRRFQTAYNRLSRTDIKSAFAKAGIAHTVE